MKQLIDLYNLADRRKIQIHNYRISDTKKAMCADIDDTKHITLDKSKIQSSIEEKELLGEELGHFETNSLYFLKHTHTKMYESNISWCEYRANRWKIHHLLPLKYLDAAIKRGIFETYELAEYFEVSENFIEEALDLYINIENYSIDI